MRDLEQVRQRWILDRPKYEAFGALLKARLEKSLKPVGIWFDVESRPKPLGSLIKKLLTKKGHTFETLPDKVGVRVIISYRSDADKVIQRVRGLFDSDEPENKAQKLGAKEVGYLSVHLDRVRLHPHDPDVEHYPPGTFWAEVQVRTLAQHLWAEMSAIVFTRTKRWWLSCHSTCNVAWLLSPGQIEVADREFDRLNLELSSIPTIRLLQVVQKHYYTVASQLPNLELSVEVLHAFAPLVKGDVGTFANHLDNFLVEKRPVIESVYAKATESGLEHTTAFLFQPEVLLIYQLLDSEPDETRHIWNQNYPEKEWRTHRERVWNFV